MKKKSTLLLVVSATIALAFGARAQVINHKGHFDKPSNSIESDFELDDVIRMPFKLPTLKTASEKTGDGLVLSTDYKYNANDQLVEKSYYKFDKIGRQIEKTTYILNDFSQSWMYSRGQWICSNITKRTYDPNDNRYIGAYIIDYETNYLDTNTGILRGSSKWKRTYSEYTNFLSAYESYYWNTTTNEWKGSSKYESTYTLNGEILSEEGIPYEWNDTTKVWKKSIDTKFSYKYKKAGKTWYAIESKDYELINGSFVVTFEEVKEPNIAALDSYSEIVKMMTDGLLANYTKKINTFNIYNRIKQSEYYSWKNNQWVLTKKDLFQYTTPDSIRTQISYYTTEYYTSNGKTVPVLCAGQSLYPISKNVLKRHPISNNIEISYSNTWTNCGWVPTGTKQNISLDVTGTKYISQIICSTNNGIDWTGCRLYSYTYNNKGKQTLYKSVVDTTNYKTETEYFSDTIITKSTDYKSADINNDGVITDAEWLYNGKRIYKYNVSSSTDSLHLNTNDVTAMTLYDLSSIKKLKITGTLSCEELYEINRLSRDSLEVLDLSDALLENNILTDSCMEETELRKLVLPKTLKTILQGSIQSGEDDLDEESPKVLKELVIYPDVELVDNEAIQAMNLEKLTIPSKHFNKIFNYAAISGINDVYKSTLKSVTFNDKTGKIQDAVCYNLPYLERVTILDGATEIGNNAFKSCGMLKEVSFPPTTLRKIGYNAFWGCNELTSLSLPDGLNTIDYSAFWGCSGVTSISMPSSLSNIAQNAFWGCSAVNSMKVDAQTPPALGNNAMQGVPRDANVSVPETSLASYKAAPQWKEFYNMKTDVDRNELKNIVLSSANGSLLLQNLPENSSVSVYSTTGAKLMQFTPKATNETIQLAKGAYLIQIGNQRFKILVN